MGRLIDSRYRVEEHLGSGAMGSVYRVRHVSLRRWYALKLLHPSLVADPKLVRRFELEAMFAGRLHHPNVVGVLDFGTVDGVSFLVMELAVGVSLADLLELAPFEPTRAARLLCQICDGLRHAHDHGMIHRDLKPDNIIVETRGGEEIARIVDFGIAVLRDPVSGAASAHDRLTARGLVVGTPHYMAPELAAGQRFDHRVDLFALGVIAYEMLTGRMPFDGDGLDVVLANLSLDAPAMSARAPEVTVDPVLEELVHRLLARRVHERLPNAAAARDLFVRVAQRVARRHGRAPGPRPATAPG